MANQRAVPDSPGPGADRPGGGQRDPGMPRVPGPSCRCPAAPRGTAAPAAVAGPGEERPGAALRGGGAGALRLPGTKRFGAPGGCAAPAKLGEAAWRPSEPALRGCTPGADEGGKDGWVKLFHS